MAEYWLAPGIASYTDRPVRAAVSTTPSSGISRGGATGLYWMSRHAAVVRKTVVRVNGQSARCRRNTQASVMMKTVMCALA